MLLLTTIAFAQKDKLAGTWELMQQPEVPLNVLRNFDIQGNYIQIVSIKSGAIITVHAAYKQFEDGKLTEQISFSTYPGNTGKTFNFNYRLSNENGRELLILEKGAKLVNGHVIPEWREVWRKVEDAKVEDAKE